MLRAVAAPLGIRKPAVSRRVLTGATGLEPATSGVTGRRSNQLSYAPQGLPIVAGSRSGGTATLLACR